LLGNELGPARLGIGKRGDTDTDTDTPPDSHASSSIRITPVRQLAIDWAGGWISSERHARQQDAGCVGTKNGENRVSLTRADGADHLISATLNRAIA